MSQTNGGGGPSPARLPSTAVLFPLPSGSSWEILSDSPPQFHQATHKPKLFQNAFPTAPQTEKKKKKNPWIPFSQNLIMQKKTCAQHNENILLNGVREKWHTQVYASDTPRYRSDVTTGTQPSGHVRKDKLGIMRHEVRKQDLSAWKWKEFLRQPLALHQLSNG